MDRGSWNACHLTGAPATAKSSRVYAKSWRVLLVQAGAEHGGEEGRAGLSSEIPLWRTVQRGEITRATRR